MNQLPHTISYMASLYKRVISMERENADLQRRIDELTNLHAKHDKEDAEKRDKVSSMVKALKSTNDGLRQENWRLREENMTLAKKNAILQRQIQSIPDSIDESALVKDITGKGQTDSIDRDSANFSSQCKSLDEKSTTNRKKKVTKRVRWEMDGD